MFLVDKIHTTFSAHGKNLQKRRVAAPSAVLQNVNTVVLQNANTVVLQTGQKRRVAPSEVLPHQNVVKNRGVRQNVLMSTDGMGVAGAVRWLGWGKVVGGGGRRLTNHLNL